MLPPLEALLPAPLLSSCSMQPGSILIVHGSTTNQRAAWHHHKPVARGCDGLELRHAYACTDGLRACLVFADGRRARSGV